MATLTAMANPPVTNINRFLGLNQDTTGETNLQLGECSKLLNWVITENYKLRKRSGYEQLFNVISAGKKIQGMWYGKLNGTYHFLFACNGTIYELNLTTNNYTSIGTLTDDITRFYGFGSNVYIINGHEYKYWNGTGSIQDVAGYIPLVAIGAPPTGGGTVYEQINLLTGKKHQQFNGNGTAKDFYIAEKAVNSIDKVIVNGTETTAYTTDLVNGKIAITTAPSTGENNVDIYWTKGTGNRTEITGMHFVKLFGGANDNRVFLYGNGTNKIYYTGLANGQPSAEYFPASNYINVDSDQYSVTGLIRHHDKLVIYKEDGAYYSEYDTITDALGKVVVTYPVKTVSDKKGNIALGQVQIIENDPFTLSEGVYKWISDTVRDERNANYMSRRVQATLDTVDLSKAITVDYEKKGEYWICVDSTVWVYNYRLDVWYMFDNIPATCFIEIDGELYFGTNNGQIMKFKDNKYNDNGVKFKSYCQLAFYNFGYDHMTKFANMYWIAMQPQAHASVNVSYRTDGNPLIQSHEFYYNFAQFEDEDFSNFSFETNYNPRPFSKTIKAKNFVYLSFILENYTIDQAATVLSITIQATLGSAVK